MPWRAGTGSVEMELRRTQDWIEENDVELNGQNGDKGVIREHREDRSFIKGALGVIIFFGGGNLVLQIIQALHLIK